MPRPANCNDEDFLASVREVGIPATAVKYGYSCDQAVRNRLNRLKAREVERPNVETLNPQRAYLTINDGTVIVASDMHWWPNQAKTTAHKALLRITDDIRPEVLIANGDVVDAAKINRHPSIGWETKPRFADELATAAANLSQWAAHADPDAEKIWNLGNHDANFENQIANHLPGMEKIFGMHLKDHFADWRPAWGTWFNWENDLCVVKHRVGKAGAAGAVQRNAVKGLCHMITSHTHAGNVWAISGYTRTLWACDTGTLARKYGPQFVNYTEDDAVNWRSSFAVLTFSGGRLLPPELCVVVDEERGLTTFRGQLVKE